MCGKQRFQNPSWNLLVDPLLHSPLHVCHHFTPLLCFDDSDAYAALKRMTFVDKITLGQSAVLGIMCVKLPSPHILSA